MATYLERQIRLENILRDSVGYGNQQTLYSDFKGWLLQNAWYRDYDKFYICGTSQTYGYTTIINFSNFNFPSYHLVYYYKDGRFLLEDTIIDDNTYYDSINTLISQECVPLFKNNNYDYSDSIFARFLVSDSMYNDLKYSKQPSEIILPFLYCLIPLLLFIFGIKVLRKGLFK